MLNTALALFNHILLLQLPHPPSSTATPSLSNCPALPLHSKHLPDDWLERMYHSCQHRRPPVPENLDHPELHPLLMAHLVCNCDSVLWFWATYESAQYCLLARLRTPLGPPNETFSALEGKGWYVIICSWACVIITYQMQELRLTDTTFIAFALLTYSMICMPLICLCSCSRSSRLCC